jgi:hypothetical protein
MMLGIWSDNRITEAPCARVCDSSELMRVPDEIRDCVCFLRASWTALPPEESPGVGTAFFVGVSLGLPEPIDRSVIYVVTARHCIEHKTAGLADEVDLFLNLRSGGIQTIRVPPSAWLRHSTADVAVLQIVPDLTTYDYKWYPVSNLATSDFLAQRTVGAGDDVFITGLLVHHPGQSKIMPIVRIGNIAALPVDPVNLITGSDVVALLEVRSIGGLSGSPVFLHLPFWRDGPANSVFQTGPRGVIAGSGGEHRLLGVMHGFYPVGRNDPDGVSSGNEDLNTGIAVVAYVDRVMDLVNSADEIAGREALKQQVQTTPVPASTRSANEESEFTEFEALAAKLIEVPKAELDDKLKES